MTPISFSWFTFQNIIEPSLPPLENMPSCIGCQATELASFLCPRNVWISSFMFLVKNPNVNLIFPIGYDSCFFFPSGSGSKGSETCGSGSPALPFCIEYQKAYFISNPRSVHTFVCNLLTLICGIMHFDCLPYPYIYDPDVLSQG